MSDINFQNFPKHENKEIRNIIKAPENHYIVSFDYAQLEARILAMASKDMEFCNAIWNNIDTHAKWSNELLSFNSKLLDKFPVIKKYKTKEQVYKGQFKLLRSDVKNNLVFKLFYGGGKKSLTSHYLPLGMSQEAMDAIYNKFWEVYSGVKKWQEEIVKFYNENGYSKSLTGRKRRYPLSYNEIINFPIQSTASFDICIVAGNYLSDIAVTKNLPQLQYRINIHDDLTFYIPEKTLLEDIITIGYNMVYPRYKFINVPLEVEYSIGTNWGNMIDTGKINTNEFFNYDHINNIWINREEKLPPLMRKAIRAKEINNTKEIII
jgi:DNA polymerase-1